MPITGTDKIFSVSIDQAKRLSRYAYILEAASLNLSPQSMEKIRILGLKILHLSSLFKEEDWEGLTEILITKRYEFPLLIQALQGKRKRIKDFQVEIESKSCRN